MDIDYSFEFKAAGYRVVALPEVAERCDQSIRTASGTA